MVTEADLRLLPAKPGVYIMRGTRGEVLYVGKARSLRNRVRSYFQNARPLDPRIQLMVGQVDRFECITTSSEVEALALESNLIKEHHPKYNVKLRDDKQYPFIRVTWREEFPQLLVVRRVQNDGDRYFGPYTDASALRDTLRLLRRLFPIRSCKHQIGVEKVERPCLNQHIHRCLGPCVGAVTAKAYREMIEQVCLFLAGRQAELIDDLEARMEQASRQLQYEQAAVLRDRLADLRKVIERQKVVSTAGEDLDVLGVALGNEDALVQAFLVRDGKLVGRKHFFLTGGAETGQEGILHAFILQHYAEALQVPPRILLPVAVEDQEALSAWLSEKHHRKVRLAVPQRGEKSQLVRMAMENAEMLLEQERVRRAYASDRAAAALTQLAEALALANPPRRIEAFDISNTQGQEAVASMAVFIEGKPAPEEYRRFRIRTVQGANDYAMLQEATGRRFRRGMAEKDAGKRGGFADLPDLLLVDGGKGQLNAVLAELEPTGVMPATIGLAKENEEIYLPGQSAPLVLPRDSEALRLVQRIRDEAHRFAVTYHRRIREKGATASLLDQISGIGPKRKRALIKQFGSVKRIFEASIDDLLAVEGMTRQSAEAVYYGLRAGR